MSKPIVTLLFLLSCCYMNYLSAAEVFKSQYAGQEGRAIKSLLTSDIDALEQGRGWGLAKAAELT